MAIEIANLTECRTAAEVRANIERVRANLRKTRLTKVNDYGIDLKKPRRWPGVTVYDRPIWPRRWRGIRVYHDPIGPRDLRSLDPIPETPRPKKRTVATVQGMVCAHFTQHYYYLDYRMLASTSRSVMVIWPRHIAMYLAHKFSGKSLSEIGRLIGGRDHATIHHAIKKIQKQLLDGDPDTTAVVNELTDLLSKPA
jgi:hypothetical protein